MATRPGIPLGSDDGLPMRLVLRDEFTWAQLNKCLREIHGNGVLYEVIIRELKPKRSIEQNARYWALLTQISRQVQDENGRDYSPETWHEYFKAKFLGKDCILLDGEPFLVQKTTTSLNVMQFGDYMTMIEVWAVEHDVRL